jgi:biopolymer transport protein ExbD
MAIFAPGIRDRHGRQLGNKNRNVVAMLSLTAMVDMFTVLVIFLLQNYNVTGEVIEIDDAVELPKAVETRELKPAHVVVVSKDNVLLDSEIIVRYNDVKEQQDWNIVALNNKLQAAFKADKEKAALPGLNQVKQTVDEAKQGTDSEPENLLRVSLQADKAIDVLTIKKVMNTIQLAGAQEINFAVLKNETTGVPAAAQ